jgi:phosphatidylglycerophosphate synthase
MPIEERRPIAARRLRIFQRMADALVRAGVSANAVSMAGMACGVLAGCAFAATPHVGWWRLAFALGAGLVQLRLLANMLDGMVALAGGKASPVGELYNEIPDRVSDVATLAGLGFALGGCPVMAAVAAFLAVMAAYVRAAARVAGAPQDYCGPMAKPHRMVAVTVTVLACAVLPRSWTMDWHDDGRGLAAIALLVIGVGTLVTIVRRLVRAGRALRGAER